MSLGTILLIAVAAAIAFIMYRVGRSSRGAADAHAATAHAVPFGQEARDPVGVAGKAVPHLSPENAVDVLKRRYAAGEIDVAEFEHKKRDVL